jgi:pilus assembly protein TadC
MNVETPFGKRSGGQPVGDVVHMVKTYAKQETIEPLRNAGRFLAFGIAGALSLGLGVTLLLVALLRALQNWMHGSMSWAPYLITIVVGAAIAGFTVFRISNKTLDR